MNYGLILAGGVGQRMRTSGMPKQFLEVFHKPIIVYTLEKFDACEEIDRLVVVCNPAWQDYMENVLSKAFLSKPISIVPGGKDRQASIQNGLNWILSNGGNTEDIISIHDGVRPLVEIQTISENIRVAAESGCCMTVRPAIESVVITATDDAKFEDFKMRDNTYSLSSPQTFKLGLLQDTYNDIKGKNSPIPLLDAAIAFTFLGNKIPYVVENNSNIKITTPQDYYILKALLEAEENKAIFGL